jgi:hypothetical protein
LKTLGAVATPLSTSALVETMEAKQRETANALLGATAESVTKNIHVASGSASSSVSELVRHALSVAAMLIRFQASQP